ncbi:MAG TPA: type IV toxin-antitoxin system AbiEi family antitoxin domain-containing protein [Solirubrobacterales bacterium]|nr:type IV toxin-antitoxin system AbiEi family antitoxin domain-containing protein [Solirubrobacterales bacterium]
MDGKVATVDERLADLAARQFGIASIGQLRHLGISDDAVRGRLLAGRLHRIHRGVYAIGYFPSRWRADSSLRCLPSGVGRYRMSNPFSAAGTLR